MHLILGVLLLVLVCDGHLYTGARRSNPMFLSSLASRGGKLKSSKLMTVSMKQKLNELGYNDLELDTMDPQVAAVVVERKLQRPSLGMPDSWTKKPSSNHVSLNDVASNTIEPVKAILANIRKSPLMMTALKISTVGCVAFGTMYAFKNNYLKNNLYSFPNILNVIRQAMKSEKSWFQIPSLFRRSKGMVAVDAATLDRLLRPTWADRLNWIRYGSGAKFSHLHV